MKIYQKSWTEGIAESINGCSSIFILADSNLPASYLDEVIDACGKSVPAFLHLLLGGEGLKTLDQAEAIYQTINAVGADRRTLFICLGGGTITDLGGYVASTFKRGVKLVLLPTTLLAMVDAAIGGKNGVNLKTPQGLLKNQIGTFYLPDFVGLNVDWLESLPGRELKSGWAEMIKHALINGDKTFLERVLECDKEDLHKLIPESAQIKASIVNQDPLETGIRASLNLGHTVAHALESVCEDLRHGEAVAYGLAFTLYASNHRTECIDPILNGIEKTLELPEVDEIWGVMVKDKKNTSGNVTDVMFNGNDIDVNFIWNKNEFTKKWDDFRKKHS